MSYLSDPKLIYEKSFATVRAEANLTCFSPPEQEIAIRLIHACGMVDLVDDLVFSPNSVAKGAAAFAAGANIVCDVNMVVKGIISAKLPKSNKIFCGLQSEGARVFADNNKHTRSAGGIDVMADQLQGAIVAIGNAPTALFHLMELIENGAPKPALVLGFPVGFVGAMESKEALISNKLNLPYIALRGRRGGSAMAAAAVNALAFGLQT